MVLCTVLLSLWLWQLEPPSFPSSCTAKYLRMWCRHRNIKALTIQLAPKNKQRVCTYSIAERLLLERYLLHHIVWCDKVQKVKVGKQHEAVLCRHQVCVQPLSLFNVHISWSQMYYKYTYCSMCQTKIITALDILPLVSGCYSNISIISCWYWQRYA